MAFDAQQRAWLDAADLVDEKWEHARATVPTGCARGSGGCSAIRDGDIALGQNTHELVVAPAVGAAASPSARAS